MHIVVLDGYTLNPGDLSWSQLEALGPSKVYDRTSGDELPGRAAQAEILLTNKTLLTRETILGLPQLKYIGVLASGTNIVDLDAARVRQIPVTNVPAYGTRSVAQATFALLLELTQRTGHHADTVRKGRWTRSADWCYWDGSLIELDGLTMGIIGFGRIGRAVGELANAFGMRVLVHSLSEKPLPPYAKPVPLETILRESDLISLHCPLTLQTRGLMNAERLSLMKPTAFLLNTSRGPLIDEVALAHALNSGGIAGAGLDVLSSEPPAVNNPLLTAKNCIITPHLAWATLAARARLMNIAVENVRAFLNGNPQNVVN